MAQLAAAASAAFVFLSSANCQGDLTVSHAKLEDILSLASCQGTLTVSCANLGDKLSAMLFGDNHYLGAAMLTLSLLCSSDPDYTQLPVVFAAAAHDLPP